MVSVWYNENNEDKAVALSGLMADGFVRKGAIDTRSIKDVKYDEIREFNECHFFAGWGGWGYAAQLAGWPANRVIWTGSAPCQPYSKVGKGEAYEDDRDLCPTWISIVPPADDDRAPIIFGEQVSDAIKYGWLDRLADDLEGKKYALWSAVLPSRAIGAADKRERLFFVAYPNGAGLEGYAWNVGQVIERAMADGYFASSGICDGTVTDWQGRDRPIKSGVPLLVDGISERMVRMYSEGFGDAINPLLAAEVIKAFIEIETLMKGK